MKKISIIVSCLLINLLGLANVQASDLKQQFVELMFHKHGIEKAEVELILNKAEKNQAVLDAIVRPWEAKPWHEYYPIFLTEKRLKAGIEFWKKHKKTLDRVEKELGVNAEIVVAIIGVETFYGTYLGKYNVLDSLYSLGFHYPKRGKFFRSELAQLILFAQEENLDIETLVGSYAGAMGWGQFIPSSYRHYAIDFDNDGKRDLINNPVDAIGSVANYFKEHNWKFSQLVALPVTIKGNKYKKFVEKKAKPRHKILDILVSDVFVERDLNTQLTANLIAFEQPDHDEYWLTLHNFYVITRYNHSPLYAMAVYQFSQQLKDAMNE